MKVQYTIPGWEPALAPGQAGAVEARSMFETKLREAGAVAPPSTVELLGLNRPKLGDLTLGPPPRPITAAFSDVEEDRRAWHTLLGRHHKSPPEDPTAYQMLVLLAELQRSEDDITARALVEGKF